MQEVLMTEHNPKLETGYYELEALANLKSMTVPDLFMVYTVQHNVNDEGKLFYNIAPVTIH